MDDTTLSIALDKVRNDAACDELATAIGRMPNALSWARRLIDSDEEWPAAVGWAVMNDVADAALREQLRERVKRTIDDAKPATQKRMRAFA